MPLAPMRTLRALLAWALLVSACDSPTGSGNAGCPEGMPSPGDSGHTATLSPEVTPRACQPHAPILIEGVHASASDPLVVEGYEISSSSANCIEVRDSENVIIRGNHLHDCIWSLDPTDPYSQEEGFAVLIGACRNIIVEDNLLERNKMGVAAQRSSDLVIRGNTIRTTRVRNSLRLERVRASTVAGNLLEDNGIPEGFWAPGYRDIGIHVLRSQDIEICDNTVLRSSSDGIAVSGQIDGGGLTTPESDWTGLATAIHIHDNLLLDNMEQGIWLARARTLAVHHNVIRTGCYTSGAGICLDFDVDGSEVHANRVLTCLSPGYITLSVSHDNHIHDNQHYSIETESEPIIPQDDPNNDGIKAGWSGIPFRPSSGNRIENEGHWRVGGLLGTVIETHVARANRERTWEEKGWFSCEIEEGLLDPGCVAEQDALGAQGIPAWYLLYDPLMADPDPYVLSRDCR